MKLEANTAYKITNPGGVDIYTIIFRGVYVFTKYGKYDSIGKMPFHKLAVMVKRWPETVEVMPISSPIFKEFFPIIINDVFENTLYYFTGEP